MRICGEEYKDKPLTGRDICDNRGIKTYYNSRTHRFSSSEFCTRAMRRSAINRRTNNDDICAFICFWFIQITRRNSEESEIRAVHISDVGHTPYGIGLDPTYLYYIKFARN